MQTHAEQLKLTLTDALRSGEGITLLNGADCDSSSLLWQQLFTDGPAVEDTDGDGYADRIRMRLVVDSKVEDSRIWAAILNFCSVLVFEVTALDLPLVSARPPVDTNTPILRVLPAGRIPATAGRNELAWGEIRRLDKRTVVVAGRSGEGIAAVLSCLTRCSAIEANGISLPWSRIVVDKKAPRTLQFLDSTETLLKVREDSPPAEEPAPVADERQSGRKTRSTDLLRLMGPQGLYVPSSHDPRGRRLDLQIKLPAGKLSHRLGVALADCVARLVLEATEITLPLATTEMPAGDRLLLQIEPKERAANSIRLLRRGSRKITTLLAQGSSEFLTGQLPGWIYWCSLEGGSDWHVMDQLRRQVADLKGIIAGRSTWGRWAHALIQQTRPETDHPKELPAVCTEHQRRISLACSALALDAPAIAPALPELRKSFRGPGETTELQEIIAELAPGSGILQGEIFISKPLPERRRLAERLHEQLTAKGYRPRLQVFNAYKPGLCWLLETILPQLKNAQERPATLELRFRPTARSKGALEMKSRWLQEVYPGPDLLARALHIPHDSLTFLAAARQRSIYRLLARDANGGLILDETFSPRCNRIPCYDGRRTAGWVHPTTGGIRLWQDRRVLLNQDIPTDREVFWKTFWESWMPEVFACMRERLNNPALTSQTAFWESFLIDVAIDETESQLPFGEEGIRPMEALHEDLYFVLLEAFKNFAARHHLPSRLQLGQIIPCVRSRSPKQGPYARLTAKPAAWPQLPPPNGALPRGRLDVISLTPGKTSWEMELGGLLERWNPSDRLALQHILQAWGFAPRPAANSKRLTVTFKAPRRQLPARAAGDGVDASLPPPVDRLLPAKEVHRWIRRLGQFPRLEAWRVGESLQGRPVYAVETRPQGGGAIRSVTKARFLRPTLFFNARHHANEVSSTETALHLLWKLATTTWGRKLLQRVNVVCVPLENADGVATLERLLPQARHHKLHAARYNALGAEYYGDYFNPAPPVPEARVKPALWERWLPEIIVDGHGVPSHEWEQPFSGYAPGKFREFWVPRTFLYAYIPYVDQPDHPRHRLGIALQDLLGTAVARDAELVASNRAIEDRYTRYARQWEPRTFPPVAGGPLVVLPLSKRVAKTNYAYREPAITAAEIITEVVDEVVSGEMLELCVRAHLIVLEALTDFLQAQPKRGIKRFRFLGNQLHLVWHRQA